MKSIGYEVHHRVYVQVYDYGLDPFGYQVNDQVSVQVRIQVWDQVGYEVRDQFRKGQVENQS